MSSSNSDGASDREALECDMGNVFARFFRDGLFTDVVLCSGAKRVKAHKIFLAKQSLWFMNYFRKNKADEVALPCDNNGKFFDFIAEVYSGTMKLDSSNYAYYLKYADFYGFGEAREHAVKFVDSIAEKQTILEISSTLCDLGLDSYCSAYALLLSSVFDEINQKQVKSKQRFFLCVSPTVFAATLKLSARTLRYEDKDLIALIDEYASFRDNVETEEQKEVLASLINWKAGDAYLYVVDYSCGWAPAAITRHLYRKVLTLRKFTVQGFQDDSAKISGDSTRWFAAAWIDSVAKSNGVTSTPVVNVTTLASSFGCKTLFNPVDYMLFDCFSSPFIGQGTKIDSLYSPNNIFSQDTKYFLSKEGTSVKQPFFSFGFGRNSLLAIHSLSINSRSTFFMPTSKQHKEVIEIKRKGPASLSLDVGLGSTAPSTRVAQLDFTDGISKTIFTNPISASSLKITMETKSQAGWWNLRVVNVDIIGQFLPK